MNRGTTSKETKIDNAEVSASNLQRILTIYVNYVRQQPYRRAFNITPDVMVLRLKDEKKKLEIEYYFNLLIDCGRLIHKKSGPFFVYFCLFTCSIFRVCSLKRSGIGCLLFSGARADVWSW